ncbi:MAG: hypothetical protein CSA34_05665 [Desulfobulbus propionicus]|nr:MAG: hypothetical protein CSA34_05665 [Desulfobulbus propionicus]
MENLRSGATGSAYLLVTPVLWTIAGLILTLRGGHWAAVTGVYWPLLVGLFLGTIKSRLIMDRVARRELRRVSTLQGDLSLDLIFPWRTRILIILMIAIGVLVRHLIHGPYIGILYGAIGWALLYSSRLGWSMWSRRRHD